MEEKIPGKEGKEKEEAKTVLDSSNVGKKTKFIIFFGIILVFIGILILFSSMMFLRYGFYSEEGIIPIYVGLLMIPSGLFLCTLGFTAITLSPKDIDYRLRLGSIIATGLCLLSAFFLLFTLNFLFLVR